MMLVEKYANHQPLNRQSEQYAREGIEPVGVDHGRSCRRLHRVRSPSTISVGQWDRFAMVRFLILPPSR